MHTPTHTVGALGVSGELKAAGAKSGDTILLDISLSRTLYN